MLTKVINFLDKKDREFCLLSIFPPLVSEISENNRGLLEFFLNGAELSLNSVNSEKLIDKSPKHELGSI